MALVPAADTHSIAVHDIAVAARVDCCAMPAAVVPAAAVAVAVVAAVGRHVPHWGPGALLAALSCNPVRNEAGIVETVTANRSENWATAASTWGGCASGCAARTGCESVPFCDHDRHYGCVDYCGHSYDKVCAWDDRAHDSH